MIRVFLLSGICLSLLTACAADNDASSYKDPARRYTRADIEENAKEQFVVYDPIEGTNRGLYKFNAKFDKYVFLPIVEGYDFVVPDYVDDRISSFFSNLGEFRNVTNSALQGKPDKAFTGIGRFAINSTVGLLGLYDPASEIGITQHKEDFGQTLGAWGADSGAYIVLPILGPSNVRDTVGMVADAVAFSFVVPSDIQDETAYSIVQYGLKPVNTRANNGFRYHETGSPFEYELVRYVTTEGRRLAVME